MKRWHIVVISCVLAVGILAAGGSFFYRYYIVPRYLEPVVEKVSTYLKDDDVLDELYNEAERLHDDGVIEDETYSEFINAYRRHSQNNEEAARAILERAGEEANNGNEPVPDSSVTTRYASSRVGVEIIQTNDGEKSGKADTSYSSERTSDRIRSEDVVEAERIVEEANATESPEASNSEGAAPEEGSGIDEQVETAYDILRENMSSDDYSAYASIMGKLDIDTLLSYASDKEGLKEYMHSVLSDEEYSNIVNLGYKYAYLFME